MTDKIWELVDKGNCHYYWQCDGKPVTRTFITLPYALAWAYSYLGIPISTIDELYDAYKAEAAELIADAEVDSYD